MRLGAVFLTLVLSIPLRAQDVALPGDVVTVGTCFDFMGLNTCGEYADVRRPDGSDKFFLRLRPLFGMMSDILYDPDGTLHTVHFFEIRTYSASFQEISTRNFYNGGPAALAMNQDLTLFALFRNGMVIPFPKSRAALPDFQVPLSVGYRLRSGDLALDQCTMYYMESSQFGETRLKRYDICRNVALPDVQVDFPRCISSEVRVGRDGSVFVEACSAVYHISTGGAVRIYALPLARSINPRSIALAPDSRSFWTVESWENTLIEVDIATGSILRGPLPTGRFTEAMTIYGTPRAAVLANITAIPTVSHSVLALFALAAITIALTRLG